MNNEYLSKLLHKIDFELVKRFEQTKFEELHFVPVVIQNSSIYVVISQDGDKTKVSSFVKQKESVGGVEFISISPSNFTLLLENILKKTDTKKSLPPVKEPDVQIIDNPDAPPATVMGDISKVKSPETKKIGQILVEEKLITQEQVDKALAESKKTGLPLGSTLVKMGLVTIKQLKDALAAQMQVSVVSEDQLASLPDSIACLSDDFVREHKVIPLSYNSKTLTVGMVNPKDTDTINQIIGMTGLKPAVLMVTSLEYERYVEQYYGNKEEPKQEQKKQQATYKKEKTALEALTEEFAASVDAQGAAEQTLWQKVQSDIDDISSDAAKYANMIVTQAIDSRASDIHIEPRLDGYITRYRIDGTLVEVVKIPAHLESSIVSRFKVLAKMNIAEHRRPQDGNFTIKYNQQSYDFRINTLPVNGKEKIVIRILAPSMRAEASYTKDIKIVGAFPDDIEKIKYLISAPNGIVLTSGPTGSGKTTTLYALLKTMNSPDTNITTIEDPVEIRLDGVNQSAVNPKAGITFANCMRAILRQDPDVILVGEIRDYETLEVAISASLTGHFVLSTIHTNSAAATVTRLIEMGAKDYLISSTLNGVLAQRLVKRLCPDCKEPYMPSEEEAKKILTDPERIKKMQETTIYRAVGCPACGGTGYKGRLAVLEILVVTKEIKKLIAQHAHDIEIEEHAVANGMRTLVESCIKHIVEGETTIDEFVRVLGLVGE
ncbi:TPA: type II/IV secretion system protein [Candidatus Galligastranaerophilus gallistercoris]|nr:type II/IV secretion system protein [Candidatus Galligastranaerophilus gallistercoris]